MTRACIAQCRGTLSFFFFLYLFPSGREALARRCVIGSGPRGAELSVCEFGVGASGPRIEESLVHCAYPRVSRASQMVNRLHGALHYVSGCR